jgi:hypothetical protein
MSNGRGAGGLVTHHSSRFRVMPKFILYCILAYLALRFVKRLLSPASGRGSRPAPREARPAQMIRCENCGMFITQTSALLVGGREFCSKSCVQKVNKV